jgi:chemotaxis-related protein WspD
MNPSVPPFAAPARPGAGHCWNEIGVWADHSCPELKSWVHCHNCPVFSREGRTLFDRSAPADYLAEWTRVLAQETVEAGRDLKPIMIFRLGDEWLALSMHFFREIEEKRAVHRIPHRSDHVLLGLVNIRGSLQLCVSVRELLGIAPAAAAPTAKNGKSHERLAVVQTANASWVFPVDEVRGVHRFAPADLQNVPVTVAKGSTPFTRGIIAVEDLRVGWLDDELLFFHLRRTVLGQ